MKSWFTYLFSIIVIPLFAQVNLVPNPSFEDTTYCPTGNVNKATDWFSPSLGTPDIFRDSGNIGACWESCEWIGVANYSNGGGYQFPRTGRTYAGFKTLGSSPGATREYISIKLSDTLEAGRKYCVSFYTSLANYSGYAFDKIGVAFSPIPYMDCSTSDPIITSNGIANQTGIISDTINWVHVYDTFIATGGELYITLGNFQNDSDLQIVPTGVPSQFTYHYFDDISVIYCDSVIVPPPTPPVYYDFTLFPNPSNGKFNITGNFPGGSEFVVYNMLGQIVCNGIALPEGNNEAPIFLDVAIGVYYYRVQSFGESLIDGMIEIVK